MEEPRVSIVIVSYNGRQWLEPCLSSVLASSYRNVEVILVDNASADDSVALVRERFPSIRVIVNSENLGFAEGSNVGIRAALAGSADYVVLLNPDTIVEPSSLKYLVEAGEQDTTVGILGGVQLTYDGTDFNSWTKTAVAGHLQELADPASARPLIPVEWVEGACLAAKRRVFDNIGLLDPIYFAFYEEIDFCRRAACHGFGVGLVTRCRIRHFRGASWEANPKIKRERDYRCDRSQFIFAITEPRRSMTANFGWYLLTLATKCKETMASASPRRAWDLARMQFGMLRQSGELVSKWKRDRSLMQRGGTA